MAITFFTAIAQTYKSAGTTSAQLSGIVTNVGDLIIVAFVSDDASGTYSCADDQTNTYQTDLARFTNAAHVSIVVFSAIAVLNAFTKVTVTHPSLTARTMWMIYLRGTNTTASRVGGTPVTATGTGNAASGSLSGAAGSALIGIAGYESDTANTYTNDSAYVADAEKAGTTGGADASNITALIGVQILTGSGSDDYNTTNSASRSWAACQLAYTVPFVYQPRNSAINHQNPGLLFKRWWQGWSRRPSGVLVPA